MHCDSGGTSLADSLLSTIPPHHASNLPYADAIIFCLCLTLHTPRPQTDLLSVTVVALEGQILNSKAVTTEVLEAALGRFGVQPSGATRAHLAKQYARTACGRARLAARQGTTPGAQPKG